MTIRVLIVDDEATARRRIRRLLASEGDVAIAGECPDGVSAVAAVLRDRPDLLLLDVQMPELDGFEVVQAIPPRERPAIIFVTAYDRYALRAFDVHAIDYVMKPVSAERLRTAMTRARDRLRRREGDARLARLLARLRESGRYQTRLAVRTSGRIVVVNLASVDWIEAADNYVCLHVGRREYLVRETLASLEARLDPDRFVRIHRSAIVQLDRVAEMRPASHGDLHVVLRDGRALTLSRTFRCRFERAFGPV